MCSINITHPFMKIPAQTRNSCSVESDIENTATVEMHLFDFPYNHILDQSSNPSSPPLSRFLGFYAPVFIGYCKNQCATHDLERKAGTESSTAANAISRTAAGLQQ